MTRVIKSTQATDLEFDRYERSILEPCLASFDGVSVDRALFEQERETVLAQARAEAEEKIREAYAEGLRRGEEAGRARFLEEVGGATEALNGAAHAMKEAHDDFLASLEPQVLELVKSICGRILKREALRDSKLIVSTVRAAVESLADRERLVVRVNPHDLAVMREHTGSLLEEFDGVRQVDVVADEQVEPGGCTVDSETLYLDAQLRTQLDRVLDALTE